MAEKKINRELSIYINDRQVINSLGGVTREITKVNAEMRNLNKNSASYDTDLKKLQGDLSTLKDKQAAFKEEIQATNEVTTAGAEAFSKFFLGLTSGNLTLAKEGLLGLKGALTGVVQTAVEFIATPIGATIAALSAIALVTKQWFDYNNSIKENTRLIENLTGKTGQAVADIRLQVESISQTFDLEFKSIANAMDNLVDNGVARNELEALDKIKNGLLTAPDKNAFIASLEQSSIVAKQVGLDLEQVIALNQQIEDDGVDPEKTYGALQKASKNLAEQSDILKVKLQDALGKAFADDILAKIKSGEITTVQALEAIGKKAEEVGLNQKQQAELTTAIFGKAGVAAGGLISITNTLTDAQNRQTKALTPLQEATKRLEESNKDLLQAQDNVFRSDGFEKWKTGLLITFNEVKRGFYDIIYDLANGAGVAEEKIKADAEKNGLQKYSDDAIKSFENYIELRKKRLGDQFNFEIALEERIALVKKNLSNVSGFDATDAQVDSQKRYEAELDALREYGKKQKEVHKEQTTDEIRDADEASKKKADAEKKAREDKKREEEKAAKEEYERALALAKAKASLAKAELDLYIATNRSKLEESQKLTPELIDEEYKRLEKIQQAQLDALQIERNSNIEEATRTAKSKEELGILKLQYDTEYETARQNLVFTFQQSTDALTKQYKEQQKQAALEQLAIENELELANADTKAQEDAIKTQQNYNADILRYKGLLEKKKITQDQYDVFAKDAKDKKDAIDRTRELNQLNSTLGGLGALAGAATQLFGQSKEMAVVSAGINGAQAITSILAQWPKFDGGFSMYAAIAAAGITTIAQIANIQKAKAPKQPKLSSVKGFFFGGDTGNRPALGFDHFGPVTGVVHQNEWVAPEVMTASPRYAPVLSYLENERQKIMGNKFADGGNASSRTAPNIPNTQQPDEMNELLRDLKTILSNGIYAKLLLGYEEAEGIDKLIKEGQKSTSNGIIE